jgi:inosose dehydratase
MSVNIRWGTDLITFSSTEYWGLGAELPHPQWLAAFGEDPKGYLDRMLDGVREAGLEGVELAPEPADWTSALRAYGSVAGFKAALEERGLTLSSSYAPGRQLIGNVLDDDADAADHSADFMRRHAEFLAEMGADIITIGNIARSRFKNASPDETATAADFTAPVTRDLHERFCDELNRIGAIVGKHGVRLAIHTDAYSVCSRPEDVATVMELTDPATVQLCVDAGHIALDGGDPNVVLRDNIDRVATMHWKDCAMPLSGHLLRGNQKERHARMLKNFRILGGGTVDWVAWMQILKDAGWAGWAQQEIDASPHPVEELRQGLEYFRRELAPIYT